MEKMYQQVRYLLLFALSFAGFAPAQAQQCLGFGKVLEVIPGCGIVITTDQPGALYYAVEGYTSVAVGEGITFTAEPTTLPQGCLAYPGAEVVKLTCQGQVPACQASFRVIPDASQPNRFLFIADVGNPNLQLMEWNLGDGKTVQGRTFFHTYSQPGPYNVCLTVSDAFGCYTQYCETVTTNQALSDCGYKISTSINGTVLNAGLVPNGNAAPLKSVKWRNAVSGQILSEQQYFQYQFPGFGLYYLCAEVESGTPGNSDHCVTTICRGINAFETGCFSPGMVGNTLECGNEFAPVCGCNGETYQNECIAMRSGLLAWWSGPCAAQSGDCQAEVEIVSINGNPVNGYRVLFRNKSVGNLVTKQLDFGDGGLPYTGVQWDTVSHFYPYGGVYRVNLTIWNHFTSCISSYTRLLVTDANFMKTDYLPGTTDYVRPGDANGDQRANVIDLLNIGIGYLKSGPPRPHASADWKPQFAPNWLEKVNNVVDYKHLDCNGDGIVNEFDVDAIDPHYSAIDTTELAFIPGKPQVAIKFPLDTLVIDAQNPPASLEIEAELRIGHPTNPVFDLYGLALALRYPDFIDPNPEADYEDNSFFGFTNHILWYPKDVYNQRQLDMGFTRKNGQGANGYGSLAKLTFSTNYIIIVDITGRTSSLTVPVVIPVGGVVAQDAQGNLISLSAPTEMDTLWIKLENVVSTKDRQLNELVRLQPNPAGNYTDLFVGDLQVQRIEVLNMVGQTIQRIQQPAPSFTYRMPLGNLDDGMYLIRIYTDKGIAEKRLVIAR